MEKWVSKGLLILIAMVCSGLLQAAVPGIPFIEDFSDMALNDTTISTADWNTTNEELSLPLVTAFTPQVPNTGATSSNTSVVARPDKAIVVADFDNDGQQDDLVYGGDGQLWLSVDGVKYDFMIPGFTYDVTDLTIVDLNQDGKMDFVAAVKNGPNRYFRNSFYNGTPFHSFDPVLGILIHRGGYITNDADDTRAVVVADINHDGTDDFVFANAGTTPNKWVDGTAWNTGPSQNITAEALDTRDITLADIDNDGDIDVLTGNNNVTSRYYINNGAGSFPGAGQDIGSGAFAVRSISSGDLNNDGLPDVVIGATGGMGYFLNSAATGFTAANGKAIGSESDTVIDVKLVDVNTNGLLDVIAGRRNASNVFYLNNSKLNNPFKISSAPHALTADMLDTRAIGVSTQSGVSVHSANHTEFNKVETILPLSWDPFRTKVQTLSMLSNTGRSSAAGDIDNDGDMDIVIGNGSGVVNELFVNDGSGQFARQTLSDDGDTRAIALADVNHDGKLDLITGNNGAANRVYAHNGTATPYPAGLNITSDAHNTRAFGLGDFNADGRLDIAVGNLGEKNRLYLNALPAGTFSSGSDFSAFNNDTRGIAVADVDKDGDRDVLFANSDSTNKWAKNDGAGNFSVVTLSGDNQVSYAIAVIDEPGGALPGIVVANNNQENRYYASHEDSVSGGGVDVAAANSTRSIAVLDLDANGVLDVVFGNSGQKNRAFLNNSWTGNGNVASDGNTVTRALVTGDFDLDGLMGMVEINHNSADKLYLYNHPPEYDLSAFIAQSLEVDSTGANIQEVRLEVDENLESGTSIDYFLSSDGGSHWYPAIPGQNRDFGVAGQDLRWRAELNSSDSEYTPHIEKLELFATRELTVIPTTGGTVMSSPVGIDCGSDCDDRFAHNGTVTLNVALDPNYVVTGWTGIGGCGTNTSCAILLDSSKTVSPVIEGVNRLTVTKTGNGTVTTDDGMIDCGSTCEYGYTGGNTFLQATPDTGWTFANGWTGSCAGEDSSCSLNMSSSQSTHATFIPQQMTVTISHNAEITVTSSVGGIDCNSPPPTDVCSTAQDYGSLVTLTAVAEPGKIFVGWTGDCAGEGASSSCVLSLDDNKTVGTSSAVTDRMLTVNKSGAGGVIKTYSPGALGQYINCGADCTELFAQNTQVSLRAEDQVGWAFDGWAGAGCDSVDGPGNQNCHVSMTSDRTINVSYVPTFTLDVVVSNGEPGGVTSEPAGIHCQGFIYTDCSKDYALNTSVVLTATPTAFGVFAGWSGGGCAGMAPTCSVTMDQVRTVSASFDNLFQLNVTVLGNGSVNSSPAGISCPGDCAEEYTGSPVVTLSASPQSAAYAFTGWFGEGCSGTGTCVITVDQARDVSATFDSIQFGLTTGLSGSGVAGSSVISSPPGINCGADCFQNYDINTVIDLTATPSASAYFSGWTGGGCDAETSTVCSVTMDQAYTVSANFARHYELTVSNSGGGTVSSTLPGISCGFDCDEFYDSGAVVNLTAIPQSADYEFIAWGGECSGSGSCSVTMSSAKSVNASFSLKQFRLDVTRSGSGASGSSISSAPAGINCPGDCMQIHDIHTSVILNAAPAASAYLSAWTGCDSTNGNNCIVSLAAAKSINAEFTLGVTLGVSKIGNGNGTISSGVVIDCGGDCEGGVGQGDTLVLNASADAGSTFEGWFDSMAGTIVMAGCNGTGSCSITVNANMTVYPRFTLDEHVLTVMQSGHGGISSVPSGITTTWLLPAGGDTDTHTYFANQNVILNAVPDSGWRLDSWGGECSGNGACVMDMLADRTASATFLINQYALSVNKTGSGSIVSDTGVIDCGITCSDDYDFGTSVTLTATPDPGWVVGSWGGVACVTPNPLTPGICKVNIGASAQTAGISFVQTFDVSINRTGSGLGLVIDSSNAIDCGTSCSAEFAAGGSVTLIATPQADSEFDGWGEPGCVGTGNCVLSPLGGNKNISATFTRLYTLSITAGSGGSVSSDVGSINCGIICADDYRHGTLVTLIPQPDAGQVFVGWSGACIGTGACVVTMDQERLVEAEFDLDGPTLTVNISGPGAVASSPAGIDCGASCVKNFAPGSSVTLIATPSAGYGLEVWGHIDCPGLLDCVLNMNEAKVLTTLFSLDSDGDDLVNNQDNCPLEANPDQADANSDGEGDVCDANSDTDSDGVFDNTDNCPSDPNPGQEDNNGFEDGVGAGDACEAFEDKSFCFPVKTAASGLAIICL